MRFIRRLMYFIAALSAILSIFIIVCAYRPDITDKIAAFLYPEQKPVEMVTAENSQQQEAVSYPAEDIKRESTDEKAEGYGTDTLGSDAIAESVVSDYVLPEQSEIVVPENVSGRNGYQQVQENSEQMMKPQGKFKTILIQGMQVTDWTLMPSDILIMPCWIIEEKVFIVRFMRMQKKYIQCLCRWNR